MYSTTDWSFQFLINDKRTVIFMNRVNSDNESCIEANSLVASTDKQTYIPAIEGCWILSI